MAWAKTEYRYEYRINKGNCECFRTENHDALTAKLAELKERHPAANYSTQWRSVRLERGAAARDYKGRPQWGNWN